MIFALFSLLLFVPVAYLARSPSVCFYLHICSGIFVYSLLVAKRLSGFAVGSDLESYVHFMNLDSFELSKIHMTEPIFWLATRAAYRIFNSGALVFMWLDLIIVLILFSSSVKAKKYLYMRGVDSSQISFYSMYIFIIFVTSFLFISGVGLIYRQLMATALLSLGFLYFLDSGQHRKGWALFIISSLVHNFVFLLLPAVLSVSGKSRFFVLLSSLAISCLLLFFDFGRNSTDFGLLTPYFVLFFYVIFAITSNFYLGNLYSSSSVYLIPVVIVCFFCMGGNEFVRIFHSLYFLFVPLCVPVFSRFISAPLVAALFVFLPASVNIFFLAL